MLETLLQFDKAITLGINYVHSPFWDSIMIAVSYKWTWVPLYAVLLGLMIKQNQWKIVLLMVGMIVLNLVLTDQISVFMKESFMRLRPCHNDDILSMLHLADGCGGRFGFVSSHSANTMGLALLISQFVKGKWVLPSMLLFAVINGYSRIYLGKHYFYDVLGGFLLAMLIAFILLFIFEKLRSRIEPET